MRDYVLILALLVGLGITFPFPFVGVLLWTWLGVMNPHMETYGVARELPLNFMVAATTVLAWLFAKERKIPPNDFILWMIFAFLIWMTFNSFFAVDPAWSWPLWDRTWKVFALGLVVAVTATSMVRIHALVWIVVISLFYYGVKGGIFTLTSGGVYHVYGPDSTIIGDNNQLAAALLMTLPLANYLRRQTANRWISNLMLVAMALTVVAILGSYSRGGYIGLAVLVTAAWARASNKMLYTALAVAVLVPAFHFMPDSFFERLNSISNYQSDGSFLARVMAWQVAFFYAMDHFPFGAGFYGPQLTQVFSIYFPNEESHAAHSIYFQVLGEQGFIGLAMYLTILVASVWRCSRIIRIVKKKPELNWALELAKMTQLSILVFCVSGAALSMAYYDVLVLAVSWLLPLTQLVAPQRLSQRAPFAGTALSAPAE